MIIRKSTRDDLIKPGRVLLISLVLATASLTGCLSSDNDDDSADKDNGPDYSVAPVGEIGGVELSVYNPLSLQYDADNQQILVGAVGSYSDDDVSGGVQAISWDADSGSFSTEVLFQDSGGDHGATNEIQVVDGDLAYLVGYHSWGNNALYAFDPDNGEFERNDSDELKVVAGLSGVNLADIALGPKGNLWVAVADASNPRIEIIDPADHEIEETVSGFELNPNNIAFTASDAVISTVAGDFSSGSHALVDLDDHSLDQTELDPDGSDLVVRASGDSDKFFRLARSNMEYIARYATDSADSAEWTKQLGDDTHNSDPNSHDLVFADSDKAYLLMMNEHEQWLVRPDAAAPSNFRDVGTLDLSAYGIMGDNGEIPAKAHAGVVVDDLLFVAMQRWHGSFSNTEYAPAYVAVFDISEWGAEEEIDTGLSAGNGDAD